MNMQASRHWVLIGLFFLAGLCHAQARDYAALKVRLLAQQDSMASRYASADADGRAKLVASARKMVLDALAEEVFPAWMGTDWDFNGVTQVPRQGQIACGYFVTTVLRDVGFRVERAKLAQQASLKIIQTICPRELIKDYGGIDVPELVRRLGNMPQGLYVVGLDIHTGFISNGPKGVSFIHASYGTPSQVVHERALESKVLAQSKRFVLGRVDNDVFLGKWLAKTAVPTLP